MSDEDDIAEAYGHAAATLREAIAEADECWWWQRKRKANAVEWLARGIRLGSPLYEQGRISYDQRAELRKLLNEAYLYHQQWST